METIKTAIDLKLAIQRLEDKQAREWPLLKEQFMTTYDTLNPLNMLKNLLKETIGSTDLKGNLLGTTVGLTAGYLSKMLMVGESVNPIKKIMGSLLQLGISAVVSNNPEAIKLVGDRVMNFFNKKPISKSEQFNGYCI